MNPDEIASNIAGYTQAALLDIGISAAVTGEIEADHFVVVVRTVLQDREYGMRQTIHPRMVHGPMTLLEVRECLILNHHVTPTLEELATWTVLPEPLNTEYNASWDAFVQSIGPVIQRFVAEAARARTDADIQTVTAYLTGADLAILVSLLHGMLDRLPSTGAARFQELGLIEVNEQFWPTHIRLTELGFRVARRHLTLDNQGE